MNHKKLSITIFMKKIQFNRCLLVGMTALSILASTSSCKFEEDDYFPESASLRVEHAIDSVQTILASAPNGWVMQYFCGTGVAQFEGFNLFANFDKNGKVTLASNHRYLRGGNAGKYTEATSLYSLLLEDGPVLAFNTWNDVLTPFVDPVSYASAPNNLVKDGEGMQGDHNFVIMSFNDDEVILRGERHGAEVRLTKCPSSWTDYMADTDKMKNYITNTSISSYYVTTETDTLYFTGLRNGRFRYCENLTNPVKLDSLACVFTPNGFRTEHTDTIGTQTFHEFTLSADSTCLVSEDGSVKVEACWDNYVASHTALWPFDNSFFSVEQTSLYNQIADELKKFNSVYSIKDISIGKSSGGNSVLGLVITLYTNAAKSRTNTAGLEITQMRVAHGEIEISIDDKPKADNNLNNIAQKADNLISLMTQFVKTINGRFAMTPDNYFLPKSCVYTSKTGGASFKLN